MQHVLDILVPLRRLRVKRISSPWNHSPEIASARRQRDWLHRQAIKFGDPDVWSDYRRCRNKVTAMTRSAKHQYLSNLGLNLKHDSSKFWKHFSHLSSHQRSQYQTNSDFTSEDINEHFLSVAQKTVSVLPSSHTSPTSYITINTDVSPLKLSEVDVQEVVECISHLDSHKAVGVDGIPAKFVKASPLCLAVLLTKLINKSISSAVFPDCWKSAVVTPIPKSRNSSSLSNFRPISVLPIFSKVLERIVSNQMIDHFNKYDLFSQRQSGFRCGHSTHDVLLHVSNCFSGAIDRGEYVGAVFLDLAKAFDCVDHSILLQKLGCYGFGDSAHSWLRSYLNNRTQRVAFQGCLSSSGPIKVGVPQGSILGPLLFSIYVNDLPSVISLSDINMYADDMELHFSHGDLFVVEKTLQADVENVSTWLVVNRLKLNVIKSLCMLIGSCQRTGGLNLTIMLDGAILKQVCSTKYLGVYFDRHLTWQVHVDYVLGRVRRKLFAMNRVRPASSRVLQLLYQAYILPVLDYCDTVWLPSNSSSTRRLERLHSKFTSSFHSSDNFNFRSSLTERRTFHTAVQVFKILNKISPPYLHGIFSYAVDVTGRSGRNLHRLFVPSVRTNYGKQSLAYRGTAIWNRLPKALYSAKTVNGFKTLFCTM